LIDYQQKNILQEYKKLQHQKNFVYRKVGKNQELRIKNLKVYSKMKKGIKNINKKKIGKCTYKIIEEKVVMENMGIFWQSDHLS